MFSRLDKQICRFIWQGRCPRVRYKTLQLRKSQGGWALTNFKNYWIASQLRATVVWLSDTVGTRWLEIEKCNSNPHSLAAFPFNEENKISMYKLGKWSEVTCLVWREVQKIYNLPRGISLLTNITQLKNFTPLKMDSGFKVCALKQLQYVHQLFKGDSHKTFEQLATEFALPRTDFYKYLQIRSFLFKHPNWKMLKTTPSAIETLLINVQNGNKILRPIRYIYRALEIMKKDNT